MENHLIKLIFLFQLPESKFVNDIELFCEVHDRVDVVSC